MILGGVQGTPVNDPEAQSAVAEKKLEEDLNQFLTLLVTQLQNQDPLDPMDATEFTSQLVQFASVEQQINANSNLEKLLNLQTTSQIADMVNFIGNNIEAKGSEVQLDNSKAEFSYSFDEKSADTLITIRDANGLTVFSGPGETDIGKHNFIWDGKGNNGLIQKDGAYTIVISAQNREGNLIDVETTISGRVTGAGAEDGVVSLFLGDVITTMDKVLNIKESQKEAVQ